MTLDKSALGGLKCVKIARERGIGIIKIAGS